MSSAELPGFAGHAYTVKVDNGMVFEHTFAVDGRSLHWESPTGSAETVSLHVRDLFPGVYFVSWIEATGRTVSEVLDLNRLTAQIFWTYADGSDWAGRAGELHTGVLIPG
jgi:hypothetical protein